VGHVEGRYLEDFNENENLRIRQVNFVNFGNTISNGINHGGSCQNCMISEAKFHFILDDGSDEEK
jgi:hypothetical protein